MARMYSLWVGVRALTTLRRVAICAWPSDQPIDVAGSHRLALANASVEAFQHVSCDIAGSSRARQDHHVAVGVGINAQSVFYEGQVAIVFPKQLRQQPIVFEGYNDASGFKLGLGRPPRCRRGRPAECCQS